MGRHDCLPKTVITLEHLDVNVVTHCNKRCVSCSHASPFTKPEFMSVKEMVDDLKVLKEFAHFEMLCLVGGEPLLHPNLLEFMREGAESGICDKVCVITNGVLLPKMPEEFWNELQVLRLSIYGGLDPTIKPMAEQRGIDHQFEFQPYEYPEFFKQLKGVPDDGVESFKNCAWKSNCYTVHKGFFHLCPQSLFFPNRFLGHQSNDGLSLQDLSEEKLKSYIERVEPFETCKICCAGDKTAAPWRESGRSEWVTLSTA